MTRHLFPTFIRIAVTILLPVCIINGLCAQPRNLLTKKYSLKLVESFLSKQAWHPYPTASDRKPWENLSDEIKAPLIREAEQLLKKEYPALPATLYLQYIRIGDRQQFERPYFERRRMLGTLVFAECIEGKGRFLDKITDGIWLLSEESTWILPAHVGAQKAGGGLPDVHEPLVDLFAAETGSLFAWTHYLLHDQLQKISPLICARMKEELQKRILIPTSTREDMWWMHTPGTQNEGHNINNWTPWICSNWLSVVLLDDENVQQRARSVYEIMISLDQFINFYPDDGGCDEGPSYWGRAAGSLFDCLELLYDVTGGKIDMYDHPLIKNMGRYLAYSYINGRYFLNFGDAPAQIDIPAHLVARYGERVNDKDMIGLGRDVEARQHLSTGELQGSLTRKLDYLFHPLTVDTANIHLHLFKDVWLPQTELMVARQDEHSNLGLYLAAMGGHNGKSHNHNDVGNFVVFVDGSPLFVDVGVGTYTAKTFSGDRYSIWTMQSAYHNLPTLNGVMEKAGPQFKARNVKYQTTPDRVTWSLDIAKAYPAEARIDSWNRTLLFDRVRQEIEMRDEYEAKDTVQTYTLSFMTPCSVEIIGKDSLMFTIKNSETGNNITTFLSFDHRQIVPTVERIPLDDEKLKLAWGEQLTRILFQNQKKVPADRIKMSIRKEEKN